MEIDIYDKEKYRQELIAYYEGILGGRFLNLNPEGMTDDELMDSIPTGPAAGTNIFDINNSCCWLYIGESVKDNFNGNDYTCVNFCSDKEGEEVVLSQNYSQFKYPMSIRTDELMPQYNASMAILQSTVDDCTIDPDSFFTRNRIGEKILFEGYLPGVTKYGKKRNCVFLAYRNVSPFQIRQNIRVCQCNYLTLLDSFPTMNIPSTTLVVKADENVTSYTQNSKNVVTIMFAKNVYLELFSDRVKAILIQKKATK